jgi:hypothetical protein
MRIPTIQIHQQYGKIGINTTPAKQEYKQAPPIYEMTRKPAVLDTTNKPGNLTIDQSRAWEALGKGDIFQFTDRIASESKQLALEGIGKIVAKGNRMADIAHNHEDAISEMAFEGVFEDFKFNYEGPFSSDSVDISYEPLRPEVNYKAGSIDVHAQAFPPEINYTPGNVEIYLLQKPSIEITPPQIDLKV